jgi:hypothetical protein
MSKRSPGQDVSVSTGPSLRARLAATLGLYVHDALFGYLLASPFVALVAGTYGTHPDGDASLQEPGGYPLVDLFFRSDRLPADLGARIMVLVLVMGLTGTFVHSAAMRSLALPSTSARRRPLLLAKATLERFFPLYGIYAAGTLGSLLIMGLSMVALFRVRDALIFAHGAPYADQRALLVSAVLLVFIVPLRLLQLAATAACVRERKRSVVYVLRAAVYAVRHAPLRLALGWSLRAALGSALLGAALRFASPDQNLALATVVHQLAMLAACALQVSFMMQVLRSLPPKDLGLSAVDALVVASSALPPTVEPHDPPNEA